MPRPEAVAVAIHDVSPATWRECRELLALADDAGAAPVSLLIVPDRHRRASVARDRAFVRAIDARLARGDEAVLHGFFHVDDGPPPRTVREWFARRVSTRGEGEFAAIDARGARERLEAGIALFDALGWPLHGFVPPAWLLNGAARAALAACAPRLDYVTVRGGIHHLPRWRFEATANLCYSPDSAARRALSALLVRRELRRARHAALLRISLHPQDTCSGAVLAHWERLIRGALETRVAVTKHGWVERVRQR